MSLAGGPPGALRILVVEDEVDISRPMQRALEREGYLVSVAERGQVALELFDVWNPDVVLLDLFLPDIDGQDVAKDLRARSTVPIIMVTARGDEADRVAGLELGADDYVVKPFSMAELIARIRSVTRRTSAAPVAAAGMSYGAVVLDPTALAAVVEGRRIRLSAKEFELLRVLVSRGGAVVRREDLVRAVWNLPLAEAANTLDVHMSWLRRKLGDDPRDPRFIETVRGIGFRLLSP